MRKKEENIEIATLNIRTLIGPEKLTELELAFEREKLDILGLAKTRRMGEGIIQTRKGNLLCYMGNTPGQKRVVL